MKYKTSFVYKGRKYIAAADFKRVSKAKRLIYEKKTAALLRAVFLLILFPCSPYAIFLPYAEKAELVFSALSASEGASTVVNATGTGKTIDIFSREEEIRLGILSRFGIDIQRYKVSWRGFMFMLATVVREGIIVPENNVMTPQTFAELINRSKEANEYEELC